MRKEILDALKEEVLKMEVQKLIQKTTLDVINGMNIPGSQTEEYARNKQMIAASLELSTLTIASLKKTIEKEDANGQ